MKTKILILILAASSCLPLAAQTADKVLESIMQRNMSIRRGRLTAEADKCENNTGLTLADPVVDVAYKWGAPAEVQNKVDLSVMQTFDYASVFGLKRQLAASRNDLIDLCQKEDEALLMLQARELLVQLVHANRQRTLSAAKIDVMQRLVTYTQKAMQRGDVSKIEVNKALLALAETETEGDVQETERQSLLSTLCSLNGGERIEFADTLYPVFFAAGYGMSSILSQRTEISHIVAKQEVDNARAASLPEVSLGYVSELTRAEKLRGIGMALSVPLWSNRGNVRRAKARQMAQEYELESAAASLAQQRQEQQQRADMLSATLRRAQERLRMVSSLPLLRKAVDAGEISQMEYITELQSYFQLQQMLIDTERDYHLALTRLAAIGG